MRSSFRWAFPFPARTCSRRISRGCPPGSPSAPKARVHRPPQGDRFPRLHERRDRARRRHEARSRRRRRLRRAAETEGLRNDLTSIPCRSTSSSGRCCPDAKLRKLVRTWSTSAWSPTASGSRWRRSARRSQAVRQKRRRPPRSTGAPQGRPRVRRKDLHQARPLPRRAMNATAGKIMIDGNAAARWARCSAASPW